MSGSAPILPIVVIAVLALSSGCGKRTAKVGATGSLEQGFQQSPAEVRQAIGAVNSSLRAGNYTAASRTVTTAISGQPLTEAQKRSVGLALQQINQAVAGHPAIDSLALYRRRQKMFKSPSWFKVLTVQINPVEQAARLFSLDVGTALRVGTKRYL